MAILRSLLIVLILNITYIYPVKAAYRHYYNSCLITGYLWTGNRTLSGTWPHLRHTVATDTSIIPLGSHVHIQGFHPQYIAEDTGGNISGCHVDVFVATNTEAYSITSYRKVEWY